MQINSSSVVFPSSPLICHINVSLYPIHFSCFDDSRNTILLTVYNFNYLLFLLPMYFIILSMGFRQWRSESPAAGQMSHTDVFTYCMAVMDILNVFGQLSFCCAIYTCRPRIMMVGSFCVCIGSSSLTLFHFLTCVERYLAVVHPILYMKLKRSHGIRLRNVSIVCAWLMSFCAVGVVIHYFPVFPTYVYFSVLFVIVMSVCYCSLAVFCVLIRSGMRSDQSKWRAFHTIIAITGALLLRFCGQVLSLTILNSMIGTMPNDCENFIFGFWMCLPSSLVLPLLFLHRNGKLACLKRKTQK